MVRVGLLEQQEVADVINECFIPFELDATDGIPEGVPAFWTLQRMWEEIPYTRVSFGGELIMDPTGEILLSPGYSKHDHHITEERGVAALFQEMVEDGAKRFAKLRSFERGSAEEAAEIERIAALVEKDIKEKRECTFDLDFFTACTLQNLGRHDPKLLEEKVCGLFTFDEAGVRRDLARTLGRFVEKEGEGYRTSAAGKLLATRTAGLLDDPDEEVRRAAAVAMHQFVGEPVPEENVLESARALWDEHGG